MRLTCIMLLLLATPVVSIRMAEEEQEIPVEPIEPHLLSCWSGCSRCLDQTKIPGMFKENKAWNVEGTEPEVLGLDELDDISCVFDSNLETFINKLTLDDITVTLGDSEMAGVVTGATLAPASEPNERNTLLLVGHFTSVVGRQVFHPTLVTIKHTSYPPEVSIPGTNMLSCGNGPIIQWAKWSAVFSIAENAGKKNECSNIFGRTTHVVQVAFSANIYLSDLKHQNETAWKPDGNIDKDMFQIDLGSDFEYLGMADLDEDNFIDLCFVVSKIPELAQAPKLRLRSEQNCKFFVEGNCRNPTSQPMPVRSQEICVSDFPETSCHGASQLIEVSKDDIDMMNCNRGPPVTIF